jgi:hypothetical protein
MVRLRRVDEAPYAEMLRLGQDLDEVLFVLGQATHFVEDLDQPFHAAWGETRAGHNEIETHGLSARSSKASAYGGVILVKNYSCFG